MQFDFGNLESPLSGTVFINGNLEPWRDALHSFHSGITRPDYVVPGMMWWDVTTNPWVLKAFQGSDDVVMGTLDTITNIFIPSGDFGKILVNSSDNSSGFLSSKLQSLGDGINLGALDQGGGNYVLFLGLNHTLQLPWNSGGEGGQLAFLGDDATYPDDMSIDRLENDIRVFAIDANNHMLYVNNYGSGRFDMSVQGEFFVGGLKVFNADGSPNFSTGWDFVSSQQSYTLGSTITIAHGLGVAPSNAYAEIVCITSSDGYAAGMRAPIRSDYNGAQNLQGGSLRYDATNIYLDVSSNGLVVSNTIVTPDNWRVVLKGKK